MPRLRFPEFRNAGEWEVKPIGSVAELKNGYAFKSTEYAASGQFRIVTISNVQNGLLVTDQIKLVTQLPLDIQAHQLLERGDTLISMTGNVGRVCRVNKESCLLNQRVGKLIPLRIEPSYFYYVLLNDRFRKAMQKRAAGGAQGNLSAPDILSYVLQAPVSLKEQQKIADCLSSLDEVITLESKKLDALKVHKKGLMQQLFPAEGETVPRLRFPEFRGAGEWEQSPLCVVAIFAKNKTPIDGISLSEYVSTENILPGYGGLTKAIKTPVLGSATRFIEGDILVSNIRPYLRKVWFSDRVGAASNDVLVIRARPTINKEYLSFILKNDAFIQYVTKGAKGLKMPRGDLSLIREYQVPHPSTKEQKAIADCLFSLDEVITLESQKLEALKVHKKGLIQQLFPSAEDLEN